jgi:hypothetical protein
MGAVSGTRTAYPSGTSDFTFYLGHVAQSLVFCVVFCGALCIFLPF